MSSDYSQEMGWKSLATSRLSSFRNRISQSKGDQQSWREWAGQKVAAAARIRGQQAASSERVALFPGWAARRYHLADSSSDDVDRFEVDVFVSGYASSHRAPEFASRSQRAFLRVAKGYAALPKLGGTESPVDPLKNAGLSPSTEDLLKEIDLPPTPVDDAQIQDLEKQLEKQTILPDRGQNSLSSSGNKSDTLVATGGDINSTYTPSDIRRFHANLEARLQPFWSSILTNRTVHLRLYASARNVNGTHEDETTNKPVADVYVTTDQEGSFKARFRVKWEDMCQHPGGLHIAFGDALTEHELLVVADLLPAPNPQDPTTTNNEYSMPKIEAGAVATARVTIPLTHSPVRVLSDIDDTIKSASIVSGARSAFRNVFVKELREAIIPGMSEWYTNMWLRGVRFHYVSNSPFELLPVINEFFQISHIPLGSINLRSYAGRSIFNNLFSAPAIRKRANVEDVLTSFPDSRFILIGDTGEQDLELYAGIARDRPDQILAVFLRDVDDMYEPIDDPTGAQAASAAPRETPIRRNSRPYSMIIPSRRNTDPTMALTPTIDTRRTPSPETAGNGAERRPIRRDTPPPGVSAYDQRMNYATYREHPRYLRMTDVERKRCDLQMRVYRARMMFKDAIPLRVFRNPDECVEAWQILGREEMP